MSLRFSLIGFYLQKKRMCALTLNGSGRSYLDTSTLDRYFRLLHFLDILMSTPIEIRGLRPSLEPEVQVQ